MVTYMNEFTLLRDALPGDFLYIDSLRKTEGSALGFIPKDVYLSVLERKRIANRDRWKYQRILVTVDNNELTGFCYYSFHGGYCKIVQIAIQNDARRWHRAMLMLDEIERHIHSIGKLGITCRVATDLESNYFWTAMGFVPQGVVTSTWLNQRESISKRQITVYTKTMGGLFPSPVTIDTSAAIVYTVEV